MSSLSRAQRLVLTLALSSSVSIGLLVARFISADNFVYGFLVWNLFLAWIPLVCVSVLRAWMRSSKPWISAQGFSLSLAWLLFLPNSFYIVSDLIHLKTIKGNVLFDAALLLSFTWNGLLLGYISLFFMHLQLLKRLKRWQAHLVVGLALLVCSFGIYLGRFLRWNTWDVVANPAGLLFDVSERVLRPYNYPQTITTTLTFFVLLIGIYAAIWQILQLLLPSKAKE